MAFRRRRGRGRAHRRPQSVGSRRELSSVIRSGLACFVVVRPVPCHGLAGLCCLLARLFLSARYCAQGSDRAAPRADRAIWPPLLPTCPNGSQTGPAGLVCSGLIAVVAIRIADASWRAARARRAACSRRGVGKQNSSSGQTWPEVAIAL